MNESMQDALEGLLGDYDTRRNREVSARNAEQASQTTFLAEAAVALDTIVVPCFENFSRALKSHNHACTIERKPLDEGHKRSEGQIQITIFAEGTTLPHGNASLSYVASTHRRKISAHRSVTTRNGGLVPGNVGVYELAQMTPGLVDQHLIELAQNVFSAG